LDIDLHYIEEVDPDFAILLREALKFKKSPYGQEVAKEIDFLEDASQKETVSYLCEGEVDKAKMSAGLAASCQHIRNILWQNAIIQAEDITAQKET
jgi:hypothetical protein